MQYQIYRTEKIIGLFILITIGLLVTFLLFNIKENKFFTRKITLKTILEKGYNIEKGTIVKVNGLRAGNVEEINLTEYNLVQVEMTVNKPFYRHIYKDAVAKVIEPLVLGSAEINILSGTTGYPLVQDNDFIKAEVSAGLTQRLEGSLTELESTVREVKKTSENAYKISENLESITNKIDKGEGSLGKLVNDPSLYDSLKKSVDATGDIAKGIKTTNDNVNKVVDNMESITRKVDKGEGSLGKLLNDSSLYDSAKDAVDSTRTIVESIKQTKIYVGLENSFYYKENVSVTRFHLKVVPRESRYFWLGGAIFTPASDSNITVDSNEHNYKVFPEFIVAQKLFDNRLTLRGGLLEGKFGGGVDYEMIPTLKDAFIVTVEGRQTFTDDSFNENIDTTLLRAKARIKFLNYFYVDIGGNNLLDKSGFFWGIGFEYLDEDISKIVGLIGAGK